MSVAVKSLENSQYFKKIIWAIFALFSSIIEQLLFEILQKVFGFKNAALTITCER